VSFPSGLCRLQFLYQLRGLGYLNFRLSIRDVLYQFLDRLLERFEVILGDFNPGRGQVNLQNLSIGLQTTRLLMKSLLVSLTLEDFRAPLIIVVEGCFDHWTLKCYRPVLYSFIWLGGMYSSVEKLLVICRLHVERPRWRVGLLSGCLRILKPK
jgi:hypothetical protein